MSDAILMASGADDIDFMIHGLFPMNYSVIRYGLRPHMYVC